MKTYRLLSVFLVVIMLSGLACSSDNGDDDLAPGSVAGKSYQVTVSSGTGLFATTGVATLIFNADGTYTTTGDQNIAQDNGTYTYTKVSSDTSEITLNSAVVPGFQATYVFTYTNEREGNFTASLPSGDTQTGTFTEL